jgi:hypothetical protein
MKTLALTFLFAINTIQFSYAQNDLEKNQIELSSFYEDGITILNWVSSQEVNTSYYLIEKSIDGINYNTLGQIKAGSSTYSNSNYSFEDSESDSGLAKYRVTLVLMGGNTITTLLETSSDMNVANSIGK